MCIRDRDTSGLHDGVVVPQDSDDKERAISVEETKETSVLQSRLSTALGAIGASAAALVVPSSNLEFGMQSRAEQQVDDKHSQGTMMEIAQPISCEAEAPTDVSDHEDVVEEIQSQDCFDESESSLNRSMATSRAEHHSVAEEDLTVEDAENAVADRQAVVSDAASASDAVKNAAAVDEPSNLSLIHI